MPKQTARHHIRLVAVHLAAVCVKSAFYVCTKLNQFYFFAEQAKEEVGEAVDEEL